MQFSLAKLLLAVLFINFVIAASFAMPPLLGFSLLTFVSLFVVPPFIIVGVVNTRGRRQAFFLGAMVSGTPHFIFSVYMAIVLVFSIVDWSGDFDEIPTYLHAIGYLLGTIGGCSGMAAHWFLTRDQQRDQIQLAPQSESPQPPPVYSRVDDLAVSTAEGISNNPR